MQTIEYKSKRLVLSKQEKEIAKSWGRLWNLFGQRDRSGKGIVLIFGDWSGYRSAQYRITHVDWCYHKEIGDNYRGTVRFTDGTTMAVWTQKVTREEIIRRELYKKTSYTELINNLIKSGDNYYDVSKENQLP